MPSKTRAGGSFPYILEEDRSEVTQPQFAIRILSVSDNEAVVDLRDEFVENSDRIKRKEIMKSIMEITVASVLQEELNPLQENLTERECWELINASILGSALTADERKKFALPQQSDTDSSVSDAAEGVSA